jgi:hypothetical protein
MTCLEEIAWLEPSEGRIEDNDIEVALDSVEEIAVGEDDPVGKTVALCVRTGACDRRGVDVHGITSPPARAARSALTPDPVPTSKTRRPGAISLATAW